MASLAVEHGPCFPTDVDSSWTEDPTRAPAVGAWSLNHWTAGDVPETNFTLRAQNSALQT